MTLATPHLKRAARVFVALFALQTVLATGPAYAQLTAAPGAPAGQRPLIDAAANGVPIVHIAPPSAAGVSRNQYQHFNVPAQGLILNNSTQNVRTQLGGWITGNLQLGTTPARIILNEVTGPNASQLRGTIEVAGQRADIVVANPNGISCDGCGFLNTAGRASLVAGEVHTGAQGAIESVETGTAAGSLHVGPKGLNAADQEQLDLVARGLVIEGEVWTRNLHAITGANKVLYATLATTLRGTSGNAPLFAVDIKQLGGMFANQIYLVATEKGLGVNSTGRVAALQGNLALSTDGDLTVKDAYAKGEVRLASSGRIETTGEVIADAAVRIAATAGLHNSGAIQAGTVLDIETNAIHNQGLLVQRAPADLSIHALDVVRNDGTIFTPGNLSIQAPAVRGSSGQMLAGAQLRIDAQTVDLDRQSVAADGDLQIAANKLRLLGSQAQASGALALRGQEIEASQSWLQAPGPVTVESSGGVRLEGAQIVSDIRVAVQGQGVSTAGATLAAPVLSVNAGGSALDNRAGRLLASSEGAGALTLGAVGIDNRRGEIRANGALLLDAGGGSVDNTGGVIAGRSGDLRGIGALVNRGGTLFTSTNLHLGGAGLDNDGGTIASEGSLSVTGAGQAIRNTGGTLQAGGYLTLSGGDIASAGGQLSAGAGMSLSGATINIAAARVGSRQNITLDASSLQAGGATLAADGAIGLTVHGDADLTGAALSAGGGIDARAANITAPHATISAGAGLQLVTGHLRGGVWSAGGALDVTATGSANLAGGGFIAGGNVRVRAEGIATDGGQVAGQNVQLDAGTGAFSNAGGVVIARGAQADSLRIHGQGIQNQRGTLVSAGGAILDANGHALDNTGGTVQVEGTLQLNASGFLNRGGTLATGNSFSLVGQGLDNTGGTIMTRGNLTIDAQGHELHNTNGRLLAQGDATVSAGALHSGGGTIAADGAATVRADTLDTSSGRITGARAMDVLVARQLTANNAMLGSEGASRIAAQGIEAAGANLRAGTDLAVTAAQSVTLTGGTATAAGALSIDAQGNLALDVARVFATGRLQLAGAALAAQGAVMDTEAQLEAAARSGAAVLNAARLTAGGALDVRGTGIQARAADIAAGANVVLQAGADAFAGADVRVRSAVGSITVAATRVEAQASQAPAAGQLPSTGFMAAQDLSITATTGGIDLAQAAAVAGRDLHLQAQQALSTRASVAAAGGRATLHANLLDNRGGVIDANGPLEITASEGEVDNTGGRIATRGALVLQGSGGAGLQALANRQGTVETSGALDLQLASFDNQGGAVTALASLTVRGGPVDNRAGTLAARGAVRIDTQGGAFEGGHGRVLSEQAEVRIDAGGLGLESAQVLAGGALTFRAGRTVLDRAQLGSGAGATLLTGALSARQAQLDALGDLSIDAAGAIDAQGSHFAAGGSASLRGNGLDNRGGVIAANGQLTIAAGASDPQAVIENAGGDIRSAQGAIVLAAGELRNAGQGALTAGRVAAATDLALTLGGALDNTGATLSAGRDLRLLAGGAIANAQGQLLSGREAQVSGAQIDNRAGLIAANANLGLTATAGGLDNTQGGTVQALGNLALSSAGDIATQGGTFAAGLDLRLTSGGGLQAAGSELHSGGQIALRADAADLTDARLAAGGDARLDAPSLQAARVDAQAGGNLAFDTGAGALALQSANLRANQALSLNAGAVDLRSVQLGANSAVTVRGADIDATSATAQSPGDVSIVAAGTLHLAGARFTAGQDLEARGTGAGTSAGAQLLAGRDLSVGNGAAFDFAGPGFDYQYGRDLTVRAQGIRTAGQQVSARNLTLDAGNGLLDNAGGSLQASGAMSLRSQGLANHAGLIAANGDLSVQAGAGAVDNAGASIYSTQGALSLAGGAVANRGGLLTAATDLAVQGASLDNTSTTIAAGRNLGVQLTGALDNSNGKLVANQGAASIGANGIVNAGGTIAGATGAGAHAGSGTLDNRAGIVSASAAGSTVSASGAFVNNAVGVISGQYSASVTGADIANDAGVIEAGAGGIAIVAQGQLSNHNSGAFRGIASSGDISIHAGSLANFTGYIGAGGALGIHAGSIDNRLGVLTGVASGAITAVNAIDNTAGAITSAGDLTLSAASLANAGQSVVFAGRNLTIRATEIDNSSTRDGSYRLGLLAGGSLDIQSASLNNTGGAIVALGDANVRATTVLTNRGGQIAGDSVTVQTPELINTGGRVDAQQRLTLRAQRFTADGSIASNGALELETTGDYTNTGTVAANGDLTVRTTGSYTNQGTVSAQRNLLLSAANLHNQAGAAIVAQRTTLEIAGALNNEGLINSSQGATTINAGILNNSDRIYGSGLNITAAVTNAPGAVIASRAGSINITGGLSNTDSAEVLALGGDINVAGNVLNRNARIDASGNVTIQGDLQNLNAGLVLGTENKTEAINKLYIIPLGSTTPHDSTGLGWTSRDGGQWVLPSTTYPLGTYGAELWAPAQTCTPTSQSSDSVCTYNYPMAGSAWALLNVAPPGTSVPDPGPPPSASSCEIAAGETGATERDTTGACGAWWAQADAYAASIPVHYAQLDAAIVRLNTDLTNRSLIDWYEQEMQRVEIVKPTVVSSQPATIFAGGNIYAASGLNQDSTIAAGGAVGGAISNQATQASQASTEYGRMRYNHRVWSGGWNESYSRELTPWSENIPGPTTYKPVPLDTLNAPRPAIGAVGNAQAGAAPAAQMPGIGNVVVGSRRASGAGVTTAGVQSGAVAATTGGGVQVAGVTAQGANAPGAVQTAGIAGAGPSGASANVLLSNAADAPLPGSVIAAGVRAGQQQAIAAVQTSFATQAAARPVPTMPSSAAVARAANPPAIKADGYTTATSKGPLNAPASRLFRINGAPGAGYLVETDPQFTDYNNFLGSDWLLNQLGLDPERQLKRYGDAFAEQRLVDEQILALTGRRFLAGYGATQDEYQDLLNAGVMYARDYQLTPGVALSAQQMASLTTDMVWLETQTVYLPDGGTTEALVPKVYLRRPTSGDFTPTGSLISGSDITLRNPNGDLTNTGTLYAHGGNNAGGVLTMEAVNISNGGTLAGNVINVNASNDVNNAGGAITGVGANSTAVLHAGRDIILRTTTQTTSQTLGTTKVSSTSVDRIATVSADNIAMTALGNIELQGAKVKASNNLTMTATGTMTSDTVENSYSLAATFAGPVVQGKGRFYEVDQASHLKSEISAGNNMQLTAGKTATFVATDINAGGHLSMKAENIAYGTAINGETIKVQATGPGNYTSAARTSQQALVSTVTAGGNLTMQATGVLEENGAGQVGTGDIALNGARIKAGGIAVVTANHDILLDGAVATNSTASEQWGQSKGFLTKTTTSTSASFAATTISASRIDAGIVLVNAGNDIGMAGGALSGTDGVLVRAGRNVVMTEALESTRQSQSSHSNKSGLAGNIGPIPIPAKDQTGNATSSATETVRLSSLSSAKGGIRIEAGGVAAIQGLEVDAAKAFTVEAGEVTTMAAIGSSQSNGTATDKGTHIGAFGWHDPGKGPGAKETQNQASVVTTLVPNRFNASEVTLTANGANGTSGILTLAGTELNAGSVALNASDKVVFEVQTTQRATVQTSQGRDIGWQKITDKGQIVETSHYNQINAASLTLNTGTIEVQAGVPTGDNASAQETLQRLAAQPGMEWVNQLQNDPALKDKLDWTQIEEVHKKWDFKKEGLTPEGAAILTIVVAWATWGLASGAGAMAGTAVGGGTLGTVVGGAVTAGVTTLASQAAVALVNNKGDIGKALDQLGSSANVRGLLTAIVTGGALAYINPALNLPGNQVGGEFITRLQTNLTGGVTRAVISSAINGTSVEEGLKDAITGALIDTAAATGANWIGSNTTGFANKVSHAIAGCIAGAARTGDSEGCSAGALGAAIGEMAAEGYGKKNDTVQFAGMMAGIAVALTGGDASQIGIASAAGSNAAANNYLSPKQKEEKERELNACKSATCKGSVQLRYLAIDAMQDAGLVIGVGAGAGYQTVEQAAAVVDLVRNLPETLNALRAIVSDPDFRSKVGEQVADSYRQRIDMQTRAYNEGGWDGSVTAGVEAGRLAVDIVAIGTAAVGAGKIVATAARAGSNAVASGMAVGANATVDFLENMALRNVQVGAINGFRSADEVNAAMRSVPDWSPAWKPGTQVAETTLNPGTRVSMVVSEETWAALTAPVPKTERAFGGWATYDNVSSQSYARNQLAMTTSMKKDVSYVIEVEITRPIHAQVGVVGAQGAAEGGGNQLHFVVPPAERASTFKFISGRQLP